MIHNINNHKNKTKHTKTLHTNKHTQKKIHNKLYNNEDYNSDNGMQTLVWGPAIWHFLHTISFNYPVKPTVKDKKHYQQFIYSLRHILPCKYCRQNLDKNLKQHPLTINQMKNRETFSKYVYELHEIVNKMLGKKSGLTYNEVKDRYEFFRSRCNNDDIKTHNNKYTKTHKNIKTHTKQKETKKEKEKEKEKGCTIPLYGKKSKCVINIVPKEHKCSTFKIDKKCKQ